MSVFRSGSASTIVGRIAGVSYPFSISSFLKVKSVIYLITNCPVRRDAYIFREGYIHIALNYFLTDKEYNIKKGYVLSNKREIRHTDKVTYIPVYYVMFFGPR